MIWEVKMRFLWHIAFYK